RVNDGDGERGRRQEHRGQCGGSRIHPHRPHRRALDRAQGATRRAHRVWPHGDARGGGERGRVPRVRRRELHHGPGAGGGRRIDVATRRLGYGVEIAIADSACASAALAFHIALAWSIFAWASWAFSWSFLASATSFF